MIYIKKEYDEADGKHIVIVHIESACCKQDVCFVEQGGKFFSYPLLEPATYGMTESILNARRCNLYWNK